MILKMYLVMVLLALAYCLPAAVDKKDKADNNDVLRKSVRYCQYQTPCAWKFYNYVDYPEIDLTNDYCECRPEQKCQIHVIRAHEGYIEYRCKAWPPRMYDIPKY